LPKDQQAVEKPERDRRHYEQVHRSDAVGMISDKGVPALRGPPPASCYIFGHTRLPDVDAELEQFAMNAWGTPQGIGKAHIAD
jgi:hypothetical protein